MFTVKGICDGNKVHLLEPASVPPNVEVIISFPDKKIHQPTRLKDVGGCLQYHGKAKTIEEMDEAIAKGVKNHWL